ncbi:FliH/SctL family protein [Heliorestis convoluta]|uniref:Putative flagellar assembly protein FliH n=1 Tax=Heliorestis convoluta TaxID=356322 RepID=A0A5Q2N2S0_9FIRM|nr:FliH/SctL family protein [Heliorestis convoluta]QGG48169.1 putative flagellar assembly protein FliH [Heliorestis convoluta]
MSKVIKSSTLLANKPKLLKLGFLEENKEQSSTFIPVPTTEVTSKALGDVTSTQQEEKKSIDNQDMVILAQEQAEQILQETHEMVQELLQKAKDQAHKILIEAKKETEEVLSIAQKEAEELKRLRSEEGYAKGYDEGYKGAIKKAKKEAEKIVVEAYNEAEAARQARLAYLKDQEKDLVDLAVMIAEKIIQYEIDRNDQVVFHITENALNKARDMSHVIIKVNPEDYPILQNYKSDLMSLIKGLRTLNIEKDETIGRGGCIIDTAYGYVDARIDAQLDELRRVISEVMNR